MAANGAIESAAELAELRRVAPLLPKMKEIPIGTLCRVVKPPGHWLLCGYAGRFCETVSGRILARFSYEFRPGKSRPMPAYQVRFPGSAKCVIAYEGALNPIVPPPGNTDTVIQERVKDSEPASIPFQYCLELPAYS
jgi:hypothetical protein